MASCGVEEEIHLGSEDLTDLKCEPCCEDGNQHEAVGMCVDCQDYLCKKCFEGHTIPRPSRDHKLLDLQQMLQSQTHMTRPDQCTESCPHHKGKKIKYYCLGHSKLACSVCLNLEHRTCDRVQYIPDVAEDLANNEEFNQTFKLLKSVSMKTQKVSDGGQRITEILNNNGDEVERLIEEYQKSLNEALNKIKTEFIEKAEAQRLKEIETIEVITDKYSETIDELERTQKEIQTLENTRQNCKLYIVMMKTEQKLKAIEESEIIADVNQLWNTTKRHFKPNLAILDTLKNPKCFGELPGVRIGAVVGADHVKDINVRTKTDNTICWITGSIVLPDNTLAVVDCKNSSLKRVDVKHEKVAMEITLPSKPWDITNINNQVAITLPYEESVVFVTAAGSMAIDRTLNVQGNCYGIHYSSGRLALSFRYPDKLQVINLQGIVLHDIITDKQGQTIFNMPYYVIFSQDNKSLFVSNNGSDSIMCVTFDGSVVATYTDGELTGQRKVVCDQNGDVFVCATGSSTIYLITLGCKKISVLLGEADGFSHPCSISYSDTENQLHVGMVDNNYIKVYRCIRGKE